MKISRKQYSRVIVALLLFQFNKFIISTLSILNYSKEQQSTIARFDPIENSWTKLGNLNMARSGHAMLDHIKSRN